LITSVLKLPRQPWVTTLLLALFCLAAAVVLGRMAADPSKLRLLVAGSMIMVLFAFSQRKPTVVIYLLLMYLPFLGFIRRLLIPVAGWNSMDPFVVVGPFMILVLVSKWVFDTYKNKLPIEYDTRLFQLVRWMLLVDLLQVFNPMQGSLFTGFAGVMFYIVPVCYMILGRQYMDEKKLKFIAASVYAVGLISAVYGYKQFFLGYSDFEDMWIDLSGYTALKVYSVFRPISFFTSASEYAHYLGIASIIGWVYFLRSKSKSGKLLSLLGLALLLSAMFIESARGIIVTSAAAMMAIALMNVRKASQKLLVGLMAVVVTAGLGVGMTKLNMENDLIYHSVIGLTDPFGEEATTVGHLVMMVEGFAKGIANPLGHGLGSTTIAAGKFNSMTVSSEVDLSNKFLATGVVGGVLYTIIMIKTLTLAFRESHRSSLHLMILGVLIAEGGQWLNGGHYSTAGLIWLMIGYIDREKGKSSANRVDRPDAE
jgi:hypothetical protein